ncbi:formate dehydrogenase subunit alpha [Mesorhizobium xinjiangense]|uniref:formate dehydrogenase subunit alpha n=1 Tax=Mesorhizobium xinjiangense TaxID=2678685 RepID=UPI0012EEA858|nr:formate dehydrogenase subunit alpha [Mesorhizobium xinjiangense]
MLRKKANGAARSPRLSSALSEFGRAAVDRRTFLKRSGLAIGGAAGISALSGGMVRKAEAQTAEAGNVEIKKSVCTHCSVGCTVIAEVSDGVWIGQEPGFDSPFNLGAHCAKGASVREHAHGERRLKYPMKLVGGEWQRISWDEAINEVGDKLSEIREANGPDAVYWMGGSKHSNEGAYLYRKFAAFWGTNNTDNQARICHSTTVAGVANTWGYGAMTNSFNDMHNSRAMLFIGSNAAEAHPVAMYHILKAKEENNAPLIVCDPRFTRTAAHADEYVRFRSGTDVALVWGILWHVLDQQLEDREYLRTRVWGFDQIREEVSRWTPDEVERVTGVPGSQLQRVARLMAENRPGTLVWCMGGTQHHSGNNNIRAYCNLQLALGNVGVAGAGTNIFRGHDNVQGATDLGPLPDSLPGYYGLSKGAWSHWARVWDVEYDYLAGKFASQELMEANGVPESRWFDAVLEPVENLEQPTNLHAMVYMGHAPNSQTRQGDLKKAMEELDLLVVIDPYPTVSAVLSDRTDNVYLLPASTQFESAGSVTASNRSVQWREKVFEPLFESKPDHEILYLLATKFGFADEMFKNIAVEGTVPVVEDVTREFNRGTWTIGYTGQSPERLKMHMANQHTFDKTTLRAMGGPADGDYYGMPWPCWGTPEMKHPGTPVLYDMSRSVMDGGMGFRARFGVERNGDNLLAEGVYPVGSEIEDGYPEFTMAMLRELGWDGDLTAEEMEAIRTVAGSDDQEAIDAINWKTDLSGGIQRVAIEHGCAPFGNAKARAVVWTFPDPVPIHREPLYTPRRDLVADYPTYEDKTFWRVPTAYASIQKNDFSEEFPLILSSGRLVEYEGGGDETRSNPWLAELQQEMFVEVNPFDANNAGVQNGDAVWVHGPEGGKVMVSAMVTERVGRGMAWMPFHFGGHFQGQDLRDKYPAGADPYVLGESTNTAQTYGYDSVTQMQESKTTLCRIERA